MLNRELDIIDLLSIMDFIVGVMNYQENLTQTDKQELIQLLDKKTVTIIDEIKKELNYQNTLLERVLNDKDKEIN